MDVNTFSFIQLDSSLGRETERQRKKCRKDSRRGKGKCKVASLQNSFIYTLYLHTVTDCTYKNGKKRYGNNNKNKMLLFLFVRYYCTFFKSLILVILSLSKETRQHHAGMH
jgi:hypothetical protein